MAVILVMGYRMANGIFVSLNYIQGARNLIPEEKLALPVLLMIK